MVGWVGETQFFAVATLIALESRHAPARIDAQKRADRMAEGDDVTALRSPNFLDARSGFLFYFPVQNLVASEVRCS